MHGRLDDGGDSHLGNNIGKIFSFFIEVNTHGFLLLAQARF
jgi:hypothetical protein